MILILGEIDGDREFDCRPGFDAWNLKIARLEK
jgi:hypothetical protein